MIRYTQSAKLYVALRQHNHAVYLSLTVAYEDKPYNTQTKSYPETGIVCHDGILYCKLDAQGCRLLYELMRIFKIETFKYFEQFCKYIDSDVGNTMQNIGNGIECLYVYQDRSPLQLINPQSGQTLYLKSFELKV